MIKRNSFKKFIDVRTLLYAALVLMCSLFSGNAYAMHISEGILPFNWAELWFIVAMPFLAVGLYRLKKMAAGDLSFKPLVGLMAAVVFIIEPHKTPGSCRGM